MSDQIKVVRFGQRNPNRGVITVVSQLQHDKLFYGVSYCNPKDKYSKETGKNLALHELAVKISKNDYIFFDKEIKHCNIIFDVVSDILDKETYPKWSENLLFENYSYPRGLKRYGNKGVDLDSYEIKNIVVASHEAKEQLLKALRYIHDLPELDPDFVMVNELVHQYLLPEKIVVENELNK